MDADRRRVVDALNRLSFGLALLEGNSFRSRTFARAARTIRSVPGDLRRALDAGELSELEGIGDSVVEVVRAVLDGETHPRLARIDAEVPPGLFELKKIQGLGAGRIRTLWRELGVATAAELEYACVENRLVDLKGFGRALQSKVLEALRRRRSEEGLFKRNQLRPVAERLTRALEDAGATVLVVGDYRRGAPVARSVDVLVQGGPEALGHSEVDGVPVRVFRCSDPDRFGALAVFHTGSDAHLDALRRHGVTLDATGMHRDGEPVSTPDEDAVYAALGLVTPAPERREAGVPLLRKGTAPPRLVRREDLLGALHNHTVASDGTATLAEMRDAAARWGLSWLGISDHSPSAWYANGLDGDRLADQARAIAALNGEDHPLILLTGVESDILADGDLDYPAEVLAAVDVVIASVHQRHGQDGDAMTRRMVTAAHQPRVAVIGHPTGRLLLGRPPTDVDIEELLDACAGSGCAIELNASPHRLDLAPEHVAEAKARGVLVSIAADAHSTSEIDNLTYGIAIARRAGLGPDDVINTWPAERVREWAAAR